MSEHEHPEQQPEPKPKPPWAGEKYPGCEFDEDGELVWLAAWATGTRSFRRKEQGERDERGDPVDGSVRDEAGEG